MEKGRAMMTLPFKSNLNFLTMLIPAISIKTEVSEITGGESRPFMGLPPD
jgi:hypothetical protein